MPSPQPAYNVFTDASGSWGCGAFWEPRCLQIAWPPNWEAKNIATKELLSVVAAADVAVWGKHWRNSGVCAHSDNVAVVSAIQSGRAKHPPLNCLLRCLFFFTAHFSISLSAVHVAGCNNSIADAISRNHDLSHFPQLSQHPHQVPSDLEAPLLNKALLWSSPSLETSVLGLF